MINAVMTFALITAIGEIIVLCSVGSGLRYFLLGSGQWSLHLGFAALNLWIHWGTMTGSMTAVTAFVVSYFVCKAMKLIFFGRFA